MYERDGKKYIIKINEFADLHHVSLRTVQKKLNAERYKAKLDGEFLRTAADGTWLTEKASEFLESTLRSTGVGFVSDSVYQRQLDEANKRFADYVAKTAPILQEASEIKALAEKTAAELDSERALRQAAEDEIKALKQALSDEKATSDMLHQELQAEKNRKIGFREWWKRK